MTDERAQCEAVLGNDYHRCSRKVSSRDSEGKLCGHHLAEARQQDHETGLYGRIAALEAENAALLERLAKLEAIEKAVIDWQQARILVPHLEPQYRVKIDELMWGAGLDGDALKEAE